MEKSKKNFKNENIINQFFTKDVHSPQEERKAQEELKTQGKKGFKLQRINMAFTPDNMEFIKTFSKIKGQTMTGFVNELINKERLKNLEKMEQIKAIIEE